MDSNTLYMQAYAEHYKKKNYTAALNGYLATMRLYPDSSEARYASQQLENLKGISGFDSLSIDDENKPTYEKLVKTEEDKRQRELDTAEASRIREEVSKAKNEEIKKNIDNMILTTCPSVEGYRITEQHGLVFGEIVMKMGFLKSLGAAVDNFYAAVSFGDNELTGTTGMLDDAREYAIKKMTASAAKRGANAIVGVDSESSMGSDVLKISIMGTAVRIEKIN